VDKKLYVERWLLLIKTAAVGAGLEARVRALDFKGGQHLALEVSRGNDALEVRYQKRWTGAGQVAVATGAALTAEVRQVHARVLGEHRRLLQNGLRRFLRRSIGLLAALESALRHDAELPRRYEAGLREVGGLSGARLAAVVRKRPGLLVKYEVLPAVALREGSVTRFAGLSRGRLVDVSELIKTQPAKAQEGREPGQNTGFRTVTVAPELAAAAGVELVAPGASDEPSGASGPRPSPRLERPAKTVGGGQTAVVVADAASAFADAACLAVECGNVDCSGVPDCST
jgi:hypothetical protein